MSNTPAPVANGDKTYVKAFFGEGKDKKENVALFLDPKNPAWDSGRPAMFGKINGKDVAIFVQAAGEKDGKAFGPFLTVSERGAKISEGVYADNKNIGTGNLRVTAQGAVRMAITLTGEADTIWGTPRKEVSNDLLAKGGLSIEKLATVRAEVASKATNDSAAKSAAPKVA